MAANVADTIVLFGDSITDLGWQAEGFVQRLAYDYARKLDVINRGLSGYNTEWALPVFEQIIAKKAEQSHVPGLALLTIWFGANDSCVPPSKQHIPLSKFSANLSRLVQIVKSPDSPHYSPKTRIILFTPPPVNTYQRAADLASRSPPLELDRKFDVTKAYAEAVKEVGKTEGVPVLDTWTALYEAADKEEQKLEKFLTDGLHLNAAGYDIVYKLLIATIKERFPELQHDKLPMVFRSWSQIDPGNPTLSLQANRPEL